jgi:GNAT superfamily N-acetyltransferase
VRVGPPGTSWRPRAQPRPADATAVRALVAATGRFSQEEIAIAVELVEEALAHGAASGYHFIFADDGTELRGYACFGPIPATRSSFDLYWIAVAPVYQHAGLGRGILIEVESQVRGLGGSRIYLDTSGRADYAPTRAFYERAGYRAEAILEDFYAPGDSKIVFAKRL